MLHILWEMIYVQKHLVEKELLDAERNARCVQLPSGSACLHWGPDRPDPGPGVMTMRRTLKRDIPQLLTQHRKKINGLCIA